MTRLTPVLFPLLLVLPAVAVRAPAGPLPPAPAAARAAAEDALWVDSVLAGLTLREKVGQMVMGWMGGEYLPHDSDAYDRLAELVRTQRVGGMLVSVGPPLEVAARLNELQRISGLPLLIAADLERGTGMRLTAWSLPSGLHLGGGIELPPALAFGAAGDPALAREAGLLTAREGRAVGIHMNFAPVLDINSNPANPIINTRSYGEDPDAVARLGTAFAAGLQAGGMLAVAKHFPGHGDADVDSHIDLPLLGADLARLRRVELVPFRAAVAAGIDGVMSAHIALPRVAGDSVPATLSPRLLSGLLRDELGFGGLIVADQLNMGALVRRYGAADIPVRAVEAGADILLIPPDVATAIDAVVAAVRSGRIAEARIDESVRRILHAKARVGLHRSRTVELDAVPAVVGGRAGAALARAVAEAAVTLVRDRDRVVPLPARGRTLLVVYSDEATPGLARVLQQELARGGGVRVVQLSGARPDLAPLLDAGPADAVVVAAFVRIASGSGTASLPGELAGELRRLAAARRMLLISFGNPYLLSQVPEAGGYLLAWGFDAASQRAAARVLRGELAPRGRLPVSLPPYHRRGESVGGGP
jgi:beta-N-acetylhexosaminidase